MLQLKVTPIVGLPQFTGWSQVVESTNSVSSRLICVFAVSGKHAGTVGRDVNQKISLAIYDSLLNKFNGLDVGVKSIVLGVMSFAIFLTLLAVSPIIRIVIGFLSFLIYEFLMMIKFGSLVYENKSKEIIILP